MISSERKQAGSFILLLLCVDRSRFVKPNGQKSCVYLHNKTQNYCIKSDFQNSLIYCDSTNLSI